MKKYLVVLISVVFVFSMVNVSFSAISILGGALPYADSTPPPVEEPAPDSVCGDVNGDGQIDISDHVAMVDWILRDGSPVAYPEQADFNIDKKVDVRDIEYLTAYMFKGGPAPLCPVDYCKAADINLNGNVEVDDILALVAYMFKDRTIPENVSQCIVQGENDVSSALYIATASAEDSDTEACVSNVGAFLELVENADISTLDAVVGYIHRGESCCAIDDSCCTIENGCIVQIDDPIEDGEVNTVSFK